MAQLKVLPPEAKVDLVKGSWGKRALNLYTRLARLVGDPQVRIGRKRLVCGRFFVRLASDVLVDGVILRNESALSSQAQRHRAFPAPCQIGIWRDGVERELNPKSRP